MRAYDSTLFNPPAPLAAVTLRNPHNGATLLDVLFLIDSGADVTLVRHELVDQLGLAVDPDRSYEVIGFDGSASVAYAVNLDLIFLRRVFRGRFLITDQDIGILGRDVLNHISLSLDGPSLQWDEQTAQPV
jgi:hypothetical protein